MMAKKREKQNKTCCVIYRARSIVKINKTLIDNDIVNFNSFQSLIQIAWLQFSYSIMSNSLQVGLQNTKLPCPSPTHGAYSNSCPSRWCHPTISSSVIPFSSGLQSLPASGFSAVRQFFASGGQSIGVSASASVLVMNIQDLFPLGLTGCISLQSRSVQFSRSVVSDYLWPHGMQHIRPPCPSPTPGVSQTHVHWVGDAI